MRAPRDLAGGALRPGTIRPLFDSILRDNPHPASIRSFVTFCVTIAKAYVTCRVRSGAVRPGFVGLMPDDLAVDCIASLFARNTNGGFPQINRYFERLRWFERTDEELISLIRRLLFNRINQEFCRLCKETDPSLERVMRNIRNAVRISPGLVLRRRFGDLWVLCEPNGTAPLFPMPAEMLERELTPYVNDRMNIPHVIAIVGSVLDGQHEYAHGYPLTDLALVIRSSFGRLDQEDGSSDVIGAGLLAGEVRRMMLHAVHSVEEEVRAWYLRAGRLDPASFDAHFRTVEDILAAEYVEDDGCDDTFFEHLARRLPGLTAREYLETHRSRLEYFVKRARKRFLGSIRRELDFSGTYADCS